jgi:hypothetical protein
VPTGIVELQHDALVARPAPTDLAKSASTRSK